MPLQQSIDPQQESVNAPNQLLSLKQSAEPQKEEQQQESVSAQAVEPQKLEESQKEAEESNAYGCVGEFLEGTSPEFRSAIYDFYADVEYDGCESLKGFIHPKKPGG